MAGTTTANSKKISHSNRAHDAEVEGRIFVAHSVKGSPRASIPNIVGNPVFECPARPRAQVRTMRAALLRDQQEKALVPRAECTCVETGLRLQPTARQRNYRANMGLLRGTQVRCDKERDSSLLRTEQFGSECVITSVL